MCLVWSLTALMCSCHLEIPAFLYFIICSSFFNIISLYIPCCSPLKQPVDWSSCTQFILCRRRVTWRIKCPPFMWTCSDKFTNTKLIYPCTLSSATVYIVYFSSVFGVQMYVYIFYAYKTTDLITVMLSDKLCIQWDKNNSQFNINNDWSEGKQTENI